MMYFLPMPIPLIDFNAFRQCLKKINVLLLCETSWRRERKEGRHCETNLFLFSFCKCAIFSKFLYETFI